MIGIYCITNKINGKKYIGQSKDIFKRMGQHFSSQDYKIDKLINDDFSAFTFEILKILPKSKINYLNLFEDYFMYKFNTVKNGYNCGYGPGGNVEYMCDETLRTGFRKYFKEMANNISINCDEILDISENLRWPVHLILEEIDLDMLNTDKIVYSSSYKFAVYNSLKQLASFDNLLECYRFIGMKNFKEHRLIRTFHIEYIKK